MEEQKTVIPELTINDNKVTLKSIKIPLMINGKEEEITMQQVTAGKRRELSKKYMSTKIQGQQISGNVDAMGFQIGILVSSIIEAPFDSTEEVLSKFPDNVIDYLYYNYNNSFGKDDEKKNE